MQSRPLRWAHLHLNVTLWERRCSRLSSQNDPQRGRWGSADPLQPFPLIRKLLFFSHFPLEGLLDIVREAACRFNYLGMILNFLLMWIHWFCHRCASNFPFDPLHIKALKCFSRGLVALRRSAGDFLWQTHIFPNRPTFGLEITGQTNEFNELSPTQWLPLAIWTQIKGYGQVRRPFQGGLYTTVTASSRFSVCADKLFKVPRMSATVPPFALRPFVLHFVVRCSFTSPTSTKVRNAKCFCDVASFLSAVGPTSGRHRCRENRA